MDGWIDESESGGGGGMYDERIWTIDCLGILCICVLYSTVDYAGRAWALESVPLVWRC